MTNIFDTITGGLPAPKQKDVEALQQLDETAAVSAKEPKFEDIIARWQKKETPEDTAFILNKLKHTIDSAAHTYAPGQEKDLNIKAAAIALDAMRKFDTKAGASPTTFAFHNLKRLSRLGSDTLSIMDPSETERVQKLALSNAAAHFEDKHNREPSIAELADLTGLPVKRIDFLNGIGQTLSESSTLTTDSGRDTVRSNALSDNDYLEYLYSSVSPVDQKIIEWASGLHSKKVLSNNEIAQKLKISAAAVSQRKARLQGEMATIRGLV